MLNFFCPTFLWARNFLWANKRLKTRTYVFVMPRGVALSNEMRRQIYHWLIVMGKSPQETKEKNICLQLIGVRRLYDLSIALKGDVVKDVYLSGPHQKSGR